LRKFSSATQAGCVCDAFISCRSVAQCLPEPVGICSHCLTDANTCTDAHGTIIGSSVTSPDDRSS
jgi:hypothetical protein